MPTMVRIITAAHGPNEAHRGRRPGINASSGTERAGRVRCCRLSRTTPPDSSIGPPPRTVCAATHAVGALGAFRSAGGHGRPRRTGRPARCALGWRAPTSVAAEQRAPPGSPALVSPGTVPDQIAHPGWASMRPGGPARSSSPPSCWRPQTRHGTARRSETAISIRHDGSGSRRKTEPSSRRCDSTAPRLARIIHQRFGTGARRRVDGWRQRRGMTELEGFGDRFVRGHVAPAFTAAA